MSDEKRLIKHLLENYEKVGLVGRPVYNTSEVVNVQINLSLLHVLDIDPDLQRFEFIGVVMMVCTVSCLHTMSKISIIFVDLCVPLCLSVCLSVLGIMMELLKSDSSIFLKDFELI